MKKILSLLILSACALTVQAQTALKAIVEQTPSQQAWAVTLSLETSVADFAAMQFETSHGMDDFTIESIEPLVALANHTLSYTLTPAPAEAVNQEYFSKAVIYSPSGAVFGTGNLLQINLKSAGAQLSADTNHPFRINNVRLAHADGREEGISDFSVNITSASDGIATATAATSSAVFTITGQKVARPAKGLYIINGQKRVIR